MKKLSTKTIEKLRMIGHAMKTDGLFSEDNFDSVLDQFLNDKEIEADCSELIEQLSDDPEIMVGFDTMLVIFSMYKLYGDDDNAEPNILDFLGHDALGRAEKVLKGLGEETKEDEPV